MNTSISLTDSELGLIEGGNPGAAAWGLAVLAGLVANYIYESVGGAQGINNGVSGAVNSMSDALASSPWPAVSPYPGTAGYYGIY